MRPTLGDSVTTVTSLGTQSLVTRITPRMMSGDMVSCLVTRVTGPRISSPLVTGTDDDGWGWTKLD